MTAIAAPAPSLGLSVLVLNRSFVAVHVTSVRRALTLLFRELAEVVHVEEGHYGAYSFDSWRELSALQATFDDPDHDWIRGVGFRLRAPRVIRLTECDRGPRQGLRFNRRNVFARDGNRCQYCGHGFPREQLNLDHVIPRHYGGKTTWENIVCSCVPCNTRKANRLPHEAHMRLLRKPVRPKWRPVISLVLGNHGREKWKDFLDVAYWNVELEE